MKSPCVCLVVVLSLSISLCLSAKTQAKSKGETKPADSCTAANITFQSTVTGGFEHGDSLIPLDVKDPLECAYLCYKFIPLPGDGLNSTSPGCKSAIYVPKKPIKTKSKNGETTVSNVEADGQVSFTQSAKSLIKGNQWGMRIEGRQGISLQR